MQGHLELLWKMGFYMQTMEKLSEINKRYRNHQEGRSMHGKETLNVQSQRQWSSQVGHGPNKCGQYRAVTETGKYHSEALWKAEG